MIRNDGGRQTLEVIRKCTTYSLLLLLLLLLLQRYT